MVVHDMKRFPSLAATLFAFVLLTFALLSVVGAVAAYKLLETQGEVAMANAVEARGRGLKTTFLRALYESWEEVATLADAIGQPRFDGDVAREIADLKRDNTWIAWAGYAGLEGTVVHASAGLLEGESVAARPWFSQGLEGPYAGDAHEAVLLSERLGAQRDEPLRFLDLAAPVKGPDRRSAGVLGVHIDVADATSLFRESADALAVDAFLVGADGKVVMAPEGIDAVGSATPSLRAAQIGVGKPFVETWPDGGRYMTVVLDDLDYRDLPAFGWSLVVRLPMDTLLADRDALKRTLAIVILAGLVAVLAVTFLYVQLYVRPFARVAKSATAIAAGEDVYPYESRRTREVAALSAALATLQTRVSGP